MDNGYSKYVMGRRYKKEVDFLSDQLKLQGNEKILDLACGYDVTGIDITSEYIEYATEILVIDIYVYSDII